jgi:hypothetical protein
MYLRFRSSSGIRTAVMRGELHPVGAGPKRSHLFTVAELERFVSARAARYARGRLGTPGDRWSAVKNGKQVTVARRSSFADVGARAGVAVFHSRQGDRRL